MASAELTPVLAPASALVSVGDPARTRTVYVAIALLLALGVALVVVTVWLVRRTRVDPEVLAPLEAMGERRWRRSADADWRRKRLDEVRPAGAVTLAHIAPFLAADAESDEHAGAEDLAEVSTEVGEAAEVEGPLHGPLVPPHALTPDELDEILGRFTGGPGPDAAAAGLVDGEAVDLSVDPASAPGIDDDSADEDEPASARDVLDGASDELAPGEADGGPGERSPPHGIADGSPAEREPTPGIDDGTPDEQPTHG